MQTDSTSLKLPIENPEENKVFDEVALRFVKLSPNYNHIPAPDDGNGLEKAFADTIAVDGLIPETTE